MARENRLGRRKFPLSLSLRGPIEPSAKGNRPNSIQSPLRKGSKDMIFRFSPSSPRLTALSGAGGLGLAMLLMVGGPAFAVSPKAAHLPTADASGVVTLNLLEALERQKTKGISTEESLSAVVIDRGPNGPIVEVIFEKGASGKGIKALKSKDLEMTYHSEYWDRAYFELKNLDAVLDLAALPGVRRVRPSAPAYTNAKAPAPSEAPRAHGLDRVLPLLQVDGRPVDGRSQKIGVLSDSFANTEEVRSTLTTPRLGVTAGILRNARNQDSGDLPREVQLLRDLRGANVESTPPSDEGAGMGELIYDIAPGIQMAFHTAFGGEAVFADGIRRLGASAAEGGADCTIIVDDVRYLAQPVYQADLITIAAEEVVKKGIPFFSAAGNDGSSTFRQRYQDIAPLVSEESRPTRGFDLHRWPNGTAFLPIPAGVTIFLKWNQPGDSIPGSQGAEIDLDMYVYSEASLTSTIIAASTDSQGGLAGPNGDPVEAIVSPGGFLAIDHFFGNKEFIPQNTSIPLEFVIQMPFSGITDLSQVYSASEKLAPSNAIFGHPIGIGVTAVGAIPWWESPNYNPAFEPTENIDPEAFSSLGGIVSIYFNRAGQFENRVKYLPDLSAVQGNNTSFFGRDSLPSYLEGYENVPDEFPNFFGTSAAAPNAAAIAALIMDVTSGNETKLTPAQIDDILKRTAIDVTGFRAAPGFDGVSGFGMIDGYAALLEAAQLGGIETPTTTPTPTPTPEPTGTPAPLSRQSFAFTETAEGWNFGSFPNSFIPPVNVFEGGALQLTSTENTNTYGFWESPVHVAGPWERSGDRPLSGTNGPATLYRALFTVSSDTTPEFATAVPSFRLRASTETFEQSDVVVVSSVTEPGVAPLQANKNYRTYFQLPISSTRFKLFFELLNFDPTDRAIATLSLDRVTVDAIAQSSLTGLRTEKVLTFGGNQQGWAFAGVGSPFLAPQSALTAGGLRVGPASPSGSSTYFGFWHSPDNFQDSGVVDGAVKLASDRLYRATFTVGSSASNQTASLLPAFRLRMNDGSLNYSAYMNIESTGPSTILPTSIQPSAYNLFFEGRTEIEQSPLIFSFDYLLPPSTNDGSLTLTLRSLVVESFQTPP